MSRERAGILTMQYRKMLLVEESLDKVEIPLAGVEGWESETVWAAPLGG
jgi:hypothetical protein